MNSNKIITILKHTLLLAILLPIIQATQLYILFDILNPILLIMPVVMGTILGTLVGYYRYRVSVQIKELEKAKTTLEVQVEEKTQELKKKNSELQESLLIDPLTCLGNRLMLKAVLEEEQEKIGSEYEEFSIMMIDIDYFKNYNDFYGHLKGDDVLKELGQFLKNTIHNTKNSAIRFGGEEFLIILPDCGKEKSIEIANELLDGVRALKIQHKKSLVSEILTISIGIGTCNSIESKNCRCMKDADLALYRAKENGRDCFEYLVIT